MVYYNHYPFGCRQRSANTCGRRSRRCGQESDDDYYMEIDLSSLLSDAFKGCPKKCENNGKFDSNKPRVNNEPNKFVVRFIVNNFSAEDITVKVVDRNLLINCKHSEKKDESNGWVARDITRRFELPSDVDIDSVKSSLSSTNIITVEFDKFAKQPKQENVINIPVIHEKAEQKLASNAENDSINNESKPGVEAENETDLDVKSVASERVNEENETTVN